MPCLATVRDVVVVLLGPRARHLSLNSFFDFSSDPVNRPSAAEALELPYFRFEGGHDLAVEPVYQGDRLDAFDGEHTAEEWRGRILAMIQEMQGDLALAHDH